MTNTQATEQGLADAPEALPDPLGEHDDESGAKQAATPEQTAAFPDIRWSIQRFTR